LSAGVDLLIHDCQYTNDEYERRVGWGHSAVAHTIKFATAAGVKRLVPFHHDPGHTDLDLDRLMQEAIDDARPPYRVTPGREGMTFDLTR